jgi:hypothetical protein
MVENHRRSGDSGDDDNNGWSKYQMMILDRLNDLREVQKETESRLRSIENEITTLKVKSSIWGGVAGVVAAAVMMAIQFLQRKS